MNEMPPLPPLAAYQDRRTGLIVFGILVIALGCLLALTIPLMLLGQVLSRSAPGIEPMPVRFLLPALLLYAGLAVMFIWLGIGSVRCRRWARALLLVFSWVWLLGGVAGVLIAAFIFPQIFDQPQPGLPPLPAAMRTVIMLITLGTCAVIYIVIPGALVCFYGSRHVRATCAARDPVSRWTDACPLPVLAISLLLGLGAAFMPLMILTYHSVVPFFGRYLSGGPGVAMLLATALVYAWAARAVYRLQPAGWWVAFLGFGVWMLSAGITMVRAGLLPMYEQMEFPPAQLEVMRRMDFLQSPTFALLSIACWVPFLGYVLYTKRFFRR